MSWTSIVYALWLLLMDFGLVKTGWKSQVQPFWEVSMCSSNNDVPHSYCQMSDSTEHGYIQSEEQTVNISIQSRPTGLAQPPYKIYIYDLPPKFNKDIIHCVTNTEPNSDCVHLEEYGTGYKMYDDGPWRVSNTHQFSLEVILHQKFLHSYYRTNNTEEADVFYIPFYPGLACFCKRDDLQIINDLYLYLNNHSKYFREGKPHIMTLAKIEREHCSPCCPTLRHIESRKVHYIGIEQEVDTGTRIHYGLANPMIVVPYPSYAHLNENGNFNITGALENHESLTNRNIFMFAALSNRRSNSFRNLILDQLGDFTTLPYPEFMLGQKSAEKVFLFTPECQGDHHMHTIEWMRHSVFCLQPPGDSPTRKSFYDSILSGCIPVVFKFGYPVKYPFDTRINYSNFIVTIWHEDIRNGKKIVDILKEIPMERIEQLQKEGRKVAPLLQYSHPPSNTTHSDAFKLILQEVGERFKL